MYKTSNLIHQTFKLSTVRVEQIGRQEVCTQTEHGQMGRKIMMQNKRQSSGPDKHLRGTNVKLAK